MLKKQEFTLWGQRAFYVLMLGSGIGMVVIKNFPVISMIKAGFALILIMSMEILVAKRRGETHTLWWGIFTMALIVILLIGFHII